MAMLFRRLGERPDFAADGPEPIEHFGPEAIALQARENQARSVAQELLAEHRGARFPRVHLFIGQGPTGAVGAAAARHLYNYGVPFGMTLAGACEKCSAEAAHELAVLAAMGVTPEEALSEDVAEDLVDSIEEDIRIVAALAPDEMDGRAKEVAIAVEDACLERVPRTLADDSRFKTRAPADGDAVFSPEYPARTREDSRLLDTVGIEGFGIPGLLLMENAGCAAAREAYLMLKESGGSEAGAVIACGKGNNGGDGFVIARHLTWWGVPARAFLFGAEDAVFGDARVNMEGLSAAGVEPVQVTDEPGLSGFDEATASAGLVVDALLGTGLAGEVRGLARKAVEAISASGRPVLAVDCPSGLDCNTGEPLGTCVRAERTVTFAAGKVGFRSGRGPEMVGELVVADIGLPAAAYGTES